MKKQNELTKEQQDKLARCESVIRDGQSAFLKTCVALTVIDAHGLYAPHKSLTAYCAATFDMDDAATTRHKQAGELLLVLSGLTADELLDGKGTMPLPTNEGQCREFNRLEPAVQKQVWEAVVASGEKITAALIRSIVRKLTGVEEKVTEPKPTPKPCAAKLTLRFEDHEVFDNAGAVQTAGEHFGVECKRQKNNLTFSLKAQSREDLFKKLASWSKVYDVQRVVIDFTEVE